MGNTPDTVLNTTSFLTKVINSYLWGTPDGVKDKLSEAIPQMKSGKDNVTIEVSMKAFMNECGRFINALNFPWISSFFVSEHLPSVLNTLYPDVNASEGYTKKEILSALGYVARQKYPAESMQQFLYRRDNESDESYQNRSFIWGTTEFVVPGAYNKSRIDWNNLAITNPDRDRIINPKNNMESMKDIPLFCIKPDGTREIKNFYLTPKINSEGMDDNFDFEGGTISNYTNAATKKIIDPSGIGKEVYFKFINDLSHDCPVTLTYDDWFLSIIDASFYFGAPKNGTANLQRMIERLWDTGVIKFLDEAERPVIYGSDGDDAISGTITTTGVDISEKEFSFHLNDLSDNSKNKSLKLYLDYYFCNYLYYPIMNKVGEIPYFNLTNHLSEYVSNGIYYIAGDGDDKVTATEANDYLSGGEGNDYLIGNAGDDDLFGGNGNDTLEGGSGNDALIGGAGEDILYGGDGDDVFFDFIPHAFIDNESDTYYGGKGTNKFQVGANDVIVLKGKDEIYGEVSVTFGHKTFHLSEAWSTAETGKYKYIDLDGNIYTFEGDTLVINDTMRIVDFKKWATVSRAKDGSDIYSALGITLKFLDETEDENNTDRMRGPEIPALPKADPVIIDLNGNGIETLAGKGVFFDHGGDGARERSGWVAATDGLLVRDLDGDGRITSGQELFGNSTRLKDGSIASNGFQALNDLDNNLDGLLDNNDSAWSSLQIWQDLNSNGVTDAGELYSLAQAGITAIDIRYATSSWTDSNGQEHRQNAEVQWSDGHKTISTDVWFDVDLDERDQGYDTSITEEVLRLPEARGFGNLPDLRQAMLRDTELQALVNRYLAEADAGKKAALLDQVIYQWAGAGDIPATVDFTVSRQQVAVLEKLTAQSITGLVRRDSGPVLLAEYEKFKSFTGAQLLAQTTFYEEMKNVVLSGYSSGPKDLTLSYRNTAELYSRLYQSGDYAHLQEVSQLLINLCVYSDTNRQRLAELHYYASLRYPGMAEYLSHDPEFSVTAETIRKKQNNFFWGGEGNQTIEATTGNNIIYGGKGNDALWGGKGDDTYIFNVGDGRDTIYDSGGNMGYVYHPRGASEEQLLEWAVQSGKDQIVFGEGITPDQLTLTRIDNHLTINFKNSNDGIFIWYYFTRSEYHVENFIFSDGTVWDLADIMARTVGSDAGSMMDADVAGDEIHAGGGDDTLNGNIGNDMLYGDEGDDELYGDEGDDILSGGKGEDWLNGGAGNNTYLFNIGDGQDYIYAESYDEPGHDTLRFGADITAEAVHLTRHNKNLVIAVGDGTDNITIRDYFSETAPFLQQIIFADGTVWDTAAIIDHIPVDKELELTASEEGGGLEGGNSNDTLTGLSGDDDLYGNDGDDTLTGGAGQDDLNGGDGSDTYIFNAGDGQDSIFDFTGSDSPAHNIVLMGEGLWAEDALVGREGNHLIIQFRGSEDRLKIYNFFAYNSRPVDQIRFADGTCWDIATVHELALIGRDDAQQMFAEEGGSEIHAGGGNDTLEGGSGNDGLYGDDGDDALYGSYGDDILSGGSGNDKLDGSSGNDTYLFNAGDGQDVISEYGYSDELNTLRFGEGLLAENALLQLNGKDLVILFKGSGDSVTIKDNFSSYEMKVKEIIFADGTVWDAEAVGKLLFANAGSDVAQTIEAVSTGSEIHAAGGDDTLKGNSGNDILYGDDGNDTLIGGLGNDVLSGGTGNDKLEGESGSDTYLFNAGDGQDEIDNLGYNVYDADTLRFGEGLQAANAIVQRSGNNLLIRFEGGTDTVTIKNYFYSQSYQIDEIIFFDGTRWDNTEIETRLLANQVTENGETILAFASGSEIHAAGGNDTLLGNSGNDRLYGDDGNDTLKGYAGNDTLVGGTGNDRLEGGVGSDTYLFNAGDGQDVILEDRYDTASDILRFGEGLLAENAIIEPVGNNLVIRFKGSDDSVTINNYFSSEIYKIEEIIFADGTCWNIAEIEKRLFLNIGTDEAQNIQAHATGSEIHSAGGDDTLNGAAGSDALYGDEGNDSLYGAGGDDTLYGGNGADFLSGSTGDDLLAGEEGNDKLNGDDGRDTLYGDAGDDVLSGGAGNDWLSGAAGNDSLDGGNDNDQLAGGAGNDTLKGYTGSDTYMFNAGDGQDIITEGYSDKGDVDTLRFGEGVLATDVVMQRSGNDLLINFTGNTDSVTVADYFSAAKYQVEHIAFADGTDWLVADVLNHIEDGIPLPVAALADAPVSLQRVREQMVAFMAGDAGEEDSSMAMMPTLSSSKTTVHSVVNF